MTDLEIIKCRSCGANMVFLMSEKNRRVPTNAESVKDGDRKFDAARHVSHFTTCNDPKRFSKKKGKVENENH